MSIIKENFLLPTKTAVRLYHEVAAREPIFDYRNQLSAQTLAQNRPFADLTTAWISSDPEKLRAMRMNGVSERLITGDASPREKFSAWAKTVPRTLRNPLYHRAHLELKRIFGIDRLINDKTAQVIWDEAEQRLKSPDCSPRGWLRKLRVIVLVTTDDPADSLEWHATLRKEHAGTRIYPTFWADQVLDVTEAKAFQSWCERLSVVAKTATTKFDDFLNALRQRHTDFHEAGCRLSGHRWEPSFQNCADASAKKIFDSARAGESITASEARQFASWMLLFLGRLDAERGWTKQLHLVTSQQSAAPAVRAYFEQLQRENCLPKTMLHNEQPADWHSLGAVAGDFSAGEMPGKIQLGLGATFLGSSTLEAQMDAISETGLLARSVGFASHAASLLGLSHHEYFRRALCQLIGHEMEAGGLPDDWELSARLVRDLCSRNAVRYFGLDAQIG